MIFVHLWWHIRHLIGVDDGSTGWYLWWSGIFGDATIFGAVVYHFHHVNCHVKGCYRIGKHDVAHGKYRVCTKHHPDHKGSDITYNDVYKAHKGVQ